MARVKIGNLTVDTALDEIDVATVRAKTPVRTGVLRDGWVIDDGDIINEVEYAGLVEKGTADRPGHFMAERSAPEIAERLARRLGEQIDRPGLIKLPEIKVTIR